MLLSLTLCVLTGCDSISFSSDKYFVSRHWQNHSQSEHFGVYYAEILILGFDLTEQCFLSAGILYSTGTV